MCSGHRQSPLVEGTPKGADEGKRSIYGASCVAQHWEGSGLVRSVAGPRRIEIGMSPSGRIAEIDYLRGFSILTISLMHLLQMMPDIPSKIHTVASIGGSGVHVFFLCSGIGLYLSYLKRKMGYIEFLKKRFAKIYVPYIIVVIVSFFLPWMYAGSDRITALLSHVLLFKMFVPRYEVSFGLHFWFMSTIIQLYLLFIPMCLLKEKIKSNRLFFGLFLGISACWWAFCYLAGITDERIWSSFCLQNIWEFALGFVIAQELADGKTYRASTTTLLIVALAGIGIQAAMAMASDALRALNDIPALLGYTALALSLMSVSAIDRAATWLSAFSYEYYLVHILVFETVFYITEPKGLASQCAIGSIAFIAAIAIAFLYHALIRFYGRYRTAKHTGDDVRASSPH